EVLRKFHPTVICAPSPKQSQMVLQRDQQFSDGKHPLCFKKLSCCQRSVWTVSPKNAMEQLNELHPGLQYDILSKSGPLHAPVFSVGVKVNGFEFEGQGSTKKQAKIKAAELALQSLVQFPNASQTQSTMENFDFTADFFTEFEPSLTDNCKLLHCSGATMQVLSNISKRRNTHSFTLDLISSTNPNRQSFPLKHQSPVALLNELLPGLRYMCQVERIHGTPLKNFIMMVRLEGKVFEGCGHSKRQAKARAAAAALQSLYNVSLGPERKLLNSQGSRTKHHLPQFFAESIYHMVREKYSQLTDGGPSSSHGRHKVLAGIVMTRGFDLRSAQVVSLATGTKCLDSMTAKDEGCTLRDCHAEVLSRRALVRFFFTQLELREEGEDQSIFVADKDSTYHFQLREGVRFHMYVSMSPCGDARLNSPYETKPACKKNFIMTLKKCSSFAINEETIKENRKFRCRLRVKVNGGEGTLPVVSQSTHQKWDSVVLGQPVHMASVSCTDKIAKWSVVGLQGALLTRLVKPIYLHSLTVGTLSHTGHLGRAITCRLAAVRHLFSFYRQQELLLGLSSREVYTAGKASNVCMNWSYGEGVLEEVSTTTGRRKVSGTPSQICRNSLFSYWLKLDNKVNLHGAKSKNSTKPTYSASKMAAGCYQRAVEQFCFALQGAGFGKWPRKNAETGSLQC
uniref:Double-stranded RNA-specific editase B2-like n=1 Tax=Cyprinodon variegatus TaxID=28743 RepID=A0A3Q2CPX1_CYPVA